jgi:Mg/Co/Ni transporter MgtE
MTRDEYNKKLQSVTEKLVVLAVFIAVIMGYTAILATTTRSHTVAHVTRP